MKQIIFKTGAAMIAALLLIPVLNAQDEKEEKGEKEKTSKELNT